MQEQQLRKTPGQSDSFFPTIHEGDDPETRYRTRRRDDDTRFRIEAMPDLLASEAKPRNVNITVDEPRIRSIEWSLRMPDGRVSPDVVRTKAGDPDATTRPFRLEPRHLSINGSYKLECTGYDSSGSMVLVAFRDFRIVGTDLTTLKEVGGKHGLLTFVDYRVDTATKPGSAVIRTEIDFLPSNAVKCPQVGWIQAVQALTPDGEQVYRYMANPDLDARATPLSWTIDREVGAPSPFYGVQKGKSGALEMDPNKGHFSNDPQYGGETLLHDDPLFSAAAVVKYESCAVCRGGDDAGQVYGCATWGFTSDDQGGAKLHPRTFSQQPSSQFSTANVKWNDWRSTMEKNQPEKAPALRAP